MKLIRVSSKKRQLIASFYRSVHQTPKEKEVHRKKNPEREREREKERNKQEELKWYESNDPNDKVYAHSECFRLIKPGERFYRARVRAEVAVQVFEEARCSIVLERGESGAG